MTSGPTTSWQIDGETMETENLFSRVAKSLQMVTAATKLKKQTNKNKNHLILGRKAMTKLDSIKIWRHCFVEKGPSSKNYGFSSSHVRM